MYVCGVCVCVCMRVGQTGDRILKVSDVPVEEMTAIQVGGLRKNVAGSMSLQVVLLWGGHQ